MVVKLICSHLEATFNEHGAELTSLFDTNTQTEFIWQADKQFWGRHAPVLFPIVGRLQDDEYIFQGNTYTMTQHGFARDMLFEVDSLSSNRVTFSLSSNDETKKNYPFDFQLYLSYFLNEDGLQTSYLVKNSGHGKMYFSIGGHPAFNVPLEEGLAFDDYFVHFSPMKSRIEIPLVGNYIDMSKKTLGQTNTDIQLNHKMFKQDAIIYETRGSNSYTIKSESGTRSVTLSYENMPFVGIWSPFPKEAPFVCIEPWCGIADSLSSNKKIEEKFGINVLEPHGEFQNSYFIKVH